MGLLAQEHAAASSAHSHKCHRHAASLVSPYQPFPLYPSALEHSRSQHPGGTDPPVQLFMVSRSSLFSFRSNTSSLRIAAFSFSSFSFSVRNRLASSSARFFPYLYWLASACTKESLSGRLCPQEHPEPRPSCVDIWSCWSGAAQPETPCGNSPLPGTGVSLWRFAACCPAPRPLAHPPTHSKRASSL